MTLALPPLLVAFQVAAAPPCSPRFECLARLYPVGKPDQGIVEDAISRWARKTGGSTSGVMNDRYPLVIDLGRKRCIVLLLHPAAVGGTPMYCYKSGTTVLIEADDDVE